MFHCGGRWGGRAVEECQLGGQRTADRIAPIILGDVPTGQGQFPTIPAAKLPIPSNIETTARGALSCPIEHAYAAQAIGRSLP